MSKEYEIQQLSNADKCKAIKAIIRGEATYYEKHETTISAYKDAAVHWMHMETGIIKKK
jgi:hypothetical protein